MQNRSHVFFKVHSEGPSKYSVRNVSCIADHNEHTAARIFFTGSVIGKLILFTVPHFSYSLLHIACRCSVYSQILANSAQRSESCGAHRKWEKRGTLLKQREIADIHRGEPGATLSRVPKVDQSTCPRMIAQSCARVSKRSILTNHVRPSEFQFWNRCVTPVCGWTLVLGPCGP